MSAFSLIEGDVVIRDSAGNAVGVVLDGAVYRLQTETKVASWIGSTAPTVGQKAMAASLPVAVASDQSVLPVSATQLPGALVGGRLDENVGAWLGSTAPTVGQKAMAASVPVTLASDQSPLSISLVPQGALTGLAMGTLILGGSTANTLQIVRATAYTEQTSGAQRSLASSSASDTSAGVGARQVEITYYTSACAGPFTETVTLNGTTAVATAATNICFIEKMVVKSVGSTGRNVGTVTLYVNSSGGGGTIGSIGIGNVISSQGDNRTFWAHHYVQSGKTVSLATLVASAVVAGNVATCMFLLRAQDPTVSTSPDVQISDFLSMSATAVRALNVPVKVTGPARVSAFGVPTNNNATLLASFDFSEM